MKGFFVISDDKMKELRHAVKNYRDKRLILIKKGVSKGALPKAPTAKEIAKAFENNPTGLNKRIREMNNFTTKGEVYKTKGGINLTKTVAKYKNREINQSRKVEELKFNRINKPEFDKGLKDYRLHKVERLQKNIQNLEYSKLQSLNYAISTPERMALGRRTAVDNFFKSIDYGISTLGDEQNVYFYDPKLKERLKRRLDRLTEDEIADLIETDDTVRTLMNYYREKENDVQFSMSYGDYIELLDKKMPSIIKHYYYLRRKKK